MFVEKNSSEVSRLTTPRQDVNIRTCLQGFLDKPQIPRNPWPARFNLQKKLENRKMLDQMQKCFGFDICGYVLAI